MISEARKYGVHVILSLVNNFDDYGGRKQYVQWAKERGQAINNDDDFYNNTVVKGYYKDHVKVHIYIWFNRSFELTLPLAMKIIKSNPFFYFIFHLFEFYRLCSRESTPLLGWLTKTIQPFLLGN